MRLPAHDPVAVEDDLHPGVPCSRQTRSSLSTLVSCRSESMKSKSEAQERDLSLPVIDRGHSRRSVGP